MSERSELRLAWNVVLAAAETPSARGVTDEIFDDVVGRHRQPWRRYHGVSHVVWVIRHVRELTPADLPLALPIAAAFFHDAIYDPRADENEARSAILAERQLARLGWPEPPIAIAARYIRATATHLTHDPPPATGDDANGCGAFLDADLAVLGAEPAAYHAYSTGVRTEYGHLDDDAWRAGRSSVLRHLLARPHLFHTAPARERWEDLARANLAAELAAMEQERR